MTNKNEFPYSNDNKRYHTMSYAMHNRYQSKVFKVSLDAGFSCPNRDGTCGYGGCTFCSSLGSGEFVQSAEGTLFKQFQDGCELMRKKWPHAKPIAYFQSFSNTHGSLHQIRECLNPFILREDVIAISIATRADCLEDEKIAYLDSLCDKKDIWIELGLQSVNDETALRINRGHNYDCFKNCIDRLSKTRIKVCVHLMNSLPNETYDMMLHTAKVVGSLKIHAVKIHMLHLMKNTILGNEYLSKPFPLLTLDEYVKIIVDQLEVMDEHIIIERLTGDGAKDEVIAPLWTLNKIVVLNEIDKEMLRRDTWQGKKKR